MSGCSASGGPMTFILLTLFPEMCAAVLRESILGRAAAAGFIRTDIRHIRDYTLDRHRRVDDYPFGGGGGMMMQAEPVVRAAEAVAADYGKKPHTVYLSPKGRVFDQSVAKELLRYDTLMLLCGHYEGIDQRALDMVVDEEVSIGDYVLTGGELPALSVIDAVARMVPGVLASEESYQNESIYSGLLEYPQYTRPAVFRGVAAPEVLTGGNHAEIARWQRRQSLALTYARRPELLKKAPLTPEELAFLETLKNSGGSETVR
ncbi:MAG TPA: tRNA (guanosine(37)-N1)-methyltransferase TrmD [Terriglobales bacterium]|nr:tRNA (guanosine(37)-N1)-methyltransferase TrmD [Terriglobales bacterium]